MCRGGPAAVASIASCDDVSLDRTVGCIRRVSGDHHTFEEVTGGTVTVIAADAQNDGALFLHLAIATGPGAAIDRCQTAGLRISLLQPECTARMTLHHGRDEAAGDGWVVGTCASIRTG